MKNILLVGFILLFTGSIIKSQANLNKSEYLIKYLDDGFIDEKDCYCKYLVEDNTKIDGPKIIELLLETDESFLKKNFAALKDEISALKLEGRTVKKLFGDKKFINMADLETKSEAIKLAVLKDYTNSYKVKNIYYNNALSQRICKALDDRTKERYFSDNVDIFSLYDSFIGFKTLDPITISNKNELGEAIRNFFLNTLEVENVRLKFNQTKDHYIISSNSQEYSIPIENYAMLLDGSLTNSDNACFFNECFYLLLMDYVKQIATDNNSRYFYSILNPLNEFIEDYHYSKLIADFPYLKINHSIYLFKRRKEEYDPFGRIGLSFPYKEDDNVSQLYSNRLFVGDIDAGKSYLKTSTKKRFYTILMNYRHELKLSHSDLRKLKFSISQITSDNVVDFLNLIDGIGYSLSRIPYRSSAPDNLKNKSFKEVFPSIFSWTNDDFGIANISCNDKSAKISFTRKNKVYKIPFGEKAMVNFIYRQDLITKEGKYIHIPSHFGSFLTHYYLLSDELADQIQLIFGNIFEI